MKSNLRFYLVFFVLLSVACGPDEDPNTNAANNSNNTNNQGDLTYDCTPNLTGEVAASTEIGAISGINSYRYEIDKETREFRVDLLGTGDQPTAELVVENRKEGGTLLILADGSRQPASSQRAILTTSDGETVELVHEARGVFLGSLNPRTVGTTTFADPDTVLRTTTFKVGEKELHFEHTVEPGGSDSIASAFVIDLDQATSEPSVGERIDLIERNENGFTTRSVWVLSASEPGQGIDEQLVTTFLQEAGYSEFLNNRAMDLLLWSLRDQAWVEESLTHLASCAAGEDLGGGFEGTIQGLRRQALDAPNCLAFAGTFVATAVAGAACVAPSPDPLTKIGGCGGFVTGFPASIYLGVECFCTERNSDELVNCGGDCDPARCSEACNNVNHEYCAPPSIVTGECVERPISPIVDAFFTRKECMCTAEIEDATGACSGGDPHVLTFDSLRYSPHAAGEFVAVRSVSDDSLEVQVRQEPLGNALCFGVAVNRAVAARVDGRVVSHYWDRDPDLYVDGEPIDFYGQYYPLAEGAYIQRQGEDYRIQSSQGDSILIQSYNVTVSVPPSREGDVEGLFGTYDGDLSNDLQDRDGNVFTLPMSYQELARDLVSTWQVSAEESLFTYTEGNSVDTYIIDGYPGNVSTVDTLPEEERESAEMICTDAGVTSSGILEACIVDVACTGDPEFVEAHVGVEAEEVAVLTNESPGPDVSGLPAGIVAAFSYDAGVEVDDANALSWQGTNGISAGSSQRVRLVDDAGDGRGAIEIVDGQLISSIDGTLTDATIFVRFYHLDPTSTDIVYRIGDSNGAGSIMSFGRSDEQGRHEDGDVEYLGGSLPGAQWHTSTQRFYGTQQQSGNHHLLRIDGQDVSTDPAPAPYSAQDFFVVGNMFNLSRDRFRGYIRALVIYGRVLDDQEIEEVETWIESR